MRWFPVVGWAERGGSFASGHGNSVPRFHITWGTGPGVLRPFEQRVLEAEALGKIAGINGDILAPDDAIRGTATNRNVIDSFQPSADQVIVTSGGIGGNFDLVRRNWDASKSGPVPQEMVSGVPELVDGLLLDILKDAGADLINTDRMWHYTEGVQNWDPIWPHHGIRILPGPSSMWFDATGDRLPAPCMP
ncbi:MAG: putative oxidoreductase, partial [Yoonia sp.]